MEAFAFSVFRFSQKTLAYYSFFDHIREYVIRLDEEDEESKVAQCQDAGEEGARSGAARLGERDAGAVQGGFAGDVCPRKKSAVGSAGRICRDGS